MNSNIHPSNKHEYVVSKCVYLENYRKPDNSRLIQGSLFG